MRELSKPMQMITALLLSAVGVFALASAHGPAQAGTPENIRTDLLQPVGNSGIVIQDFQEVLQTQNRTGSPPFTPCECDGKLTRLVVTYNRPSGYPSSVRIRVQKKDNDIGNAVMFESTSSNVIDNVTDGQNLVIVTRPGENDFDSNTHFQIFQNGTFTEVDEDDEFDIHTSCSQDLYTGLEFGNPTAFEVREFVSKSGFKASCQVSSIGDLVWDDQDRGADYDSGEPGLNNVTLELYGGSCANLPDTPIATKVTAAGSSNNGASDGFYLFEGLPSGFYCVNVKDNTVPANYSSTTNNDPLPVTLDQNVNFRNADFGYALTGNSIGDRVWYDLNSNGSQDGNEIGINDVTVNLYNGTCPPSGGVAQSKTTSGDGNYVFTGLSDGDYCVQVDESTLPSASTVSYNRTFPSTYPTSVVSLGPNENKDDVDFGYVSNNQCLPTIDFDTNALGAALPAGTYLSNQWAGWGVNISAVAGGSGTGPAMIFDSANPPDNEDTDLGTPHQDFGGPGIGGGGAAGQPGQNSVAKGNVMIISEDGSQSRPDDNGAGGTITLTFVNPVRIDFLEVLDIDNDEVGGTIKTFDATSGGNQLTSSDMLGLGGNSFQSVPVNASNVRRLEVAFPSSGAVPAITFCGTPPQLYEVGDFIWNDLNADGDQDGGEPGLPNVKMELYVGNTLAETTQTDGSGIYTFTNLPAGSYTVKVSDDNFGPGGALVGYTPSPQNQGGNDTKDSDFDPVTRTAAVSVGPDNLTIDGGFNENINVCYAVADGTTSASDGDADDTLAFLDRLTGATAAVGSGVGNTGENNIEAIAFNPGGTILYAADANQLGTLNLITGDFTATSQTFGTAGGDDGNENLNDVDGLSFDPTTGFFYGTERRDGTDLLFRIDPATGAHVPNAFGSDDYVEIGTVNDPNDGILDDVDDIAVDPVTGVMYGSINEGGSTANYLVTINKSTGAVSVIGKINDGSNDIQDIEGLAFFNDGKLYGSSGKNGPTTNALYLLNETNAQATLIGQFTEPLRDIEALACLTAQASIKVEKSTNGEDADNLPGPSVAVGSTVTWTYFVRNTGGVTLNNVTVTDDKETISCSIGTLAPGASQTCTQTGIAQAGQYTNTATATGTRQDNGQQVQDTDPSHYNGAVNYVITKQNISDPDLDGVRVGEAISFSIRITNTGTATITVLPLQDTYNSTYLTYPGGANPIHDSSSVGLIEWNDLTAAGASGFGVDLLPGQSFEVTVPLIGVKDTTQLPGEVTLNTATVVNGVYDPDGPGGQPPQPLPDKSAQAPAKVVAPTAVDIADSALVYSEGAVQLSWRTISEADTQGFHILRSLNGEPAQRLTAQMIPAQRPGQAEGAVYSYTDTDVQPGASYRYILESQGFDGTASQTPLGDVQATNIRLFLPSVDR